MVSTAALQSNCTGLTVHTDHRCEWERELTYLTLVNCPGSDPPPPCDHKHALKLKYFYLINIYIIYIFLIIGVNGRVDPPEAPPGVVPR